MNKPSLYTWKRLGKAISIAGISALAYLDSGCASLKSVSYNLNPQKSSIIKNALPEVQRGNYGVGWNIKGNALTKASSNKENFDLESIISDGRRFYVSTNTEKAANELDFLLMDVKNVVLTINDQNKKVGYETDVYFIPQRLQDKEGKNISYVSFKTDGPRAIKAKRQDMSMDIKELDYAIVKTSNQDISYTLKTFRIGGRDYYSPFISSPTSNEANFLLIPVEGTMRKISPDGKIALESNGGVYGVKSVSSSDYAKRTVIRLNREKVEKEKRESLEKIEKEKKKTEELKNKSFKDLHSPGRATVGELK